MKYQKTLVIVNTNKEASKKIAQDISVFLSGRGISSEFFDFNGFAVDKPELFKGYDFVITLGGDGTVLFAARNCVHLNIPVFPVNLGEFGFLASVQPDDWEKSLEAFLEDKCYCSERMMLEIELLRNGKKEYSSLALNDTVISTKSSINTISMSVSHNGLSLCRLKSDGVIISSPTGSTAYSVSAGGPIVEPGLDAIIMTPMNSFSLSSRPIVLNPDVELSVTMLPCRTKEIYLTVDGKPSVGLECGDEVHVRKIKQKIKLVNCTDENFYNALRSKLNWSGVPHA